MDPGRPVLRDALRICERALCDRILFHALAQTATPSANYCSAASSIRRHRAASHRHRIPSHVRSVAHANRGAPPAALPPQSPFDGDDEEQLFRRILESEPRISRDLTGNARSFLTSLLKRKVEERLGCGRDGQKNVRSHDFFKTINWELLEARQVGAAVADSVDQGAGALYACGVCV